jgi:hypothetical protein
MKTIKFSVHHGNANTATRHTGKSVSAILTSIKSSYSVSPENPLFAGVVSSLENAGKAQHGWADYSLLPKYVFPSIAGLRASLVANQKTLRRICSREDCADPIDPDCAAGTDVRLRVTETGWQVLTGSSDYDPDHRGRRGASFLPYGRANLTDLAKDLISQARDQEADNA